MRAVLSRVPPEALGLFLLSQPPFEPEFFKAALNAVVAEEQALDGPEVLPHRTSAQIGLLAHRGQDSRTLAKSPGRLTPPTPPLS
jgi:hypothetical protein